uniref:Fibronectin type-III domain-containing protein n=1 Tax=Seriola lalandi dorsalis TaxID=1841481 RepID=A0A3B4XTA5_SERLL
MKYLKKCFRSENISSHFQIVVTDSGWLLEPQEFTVPGNQSHLDIWGLITGIGYEVRLTGVSESGLLSRPLTTVAVTGTTQCTARHSRSYCV